MITHVSFQQTYLYIHDDTCQLPADLYNDALPTVTLCTALTDLRSATLTNW